MNSIFTTTMTSDFTEDMAFELGGIGQVGSLKSGRGRDERRMPWQRDADQRRWENGRYGRRAQHSPSFACSDGSRRRGVMRNTFVSTY